MSDEIYRVKVGMAYSLNGSGGEWRYHESEDGLRRELTRAHVDMLSGATRVEPKWRIARMWRALWRGDDEAYPRVNSVNAVERHTDAGWVPVEYRVIEPDVVIGGEQ